eukprot:2504843-Alexandrium_andersonii.AAC.1
MAVPGHAPASVKSGQGPPPADERIALQQVSIRGAFTSLIGLEGGHNLTARGTLRSLTPSTSVTA